MFNYRQDCSEFQLESAWICLAFRTTAVSEGCGSFLIEPDTLQFVQQCLRFNCGKLTARVGTKWPHIVCECINWAALLCCLSEETGCSVQIGRMDLLALDLHIWDFFFFSVERRRCPCSIYVLLLFRLSSSSSSLDGNVKSRLEICAFASVQILHQGE